MHKKKFYRKYNCFALLLIYVYRVNPVNNKRNNYGYKCFTEDTTFVYFEQSAEYSRMIDGNCQLHVPRIIAFRINHESYCE